MYLIQLTDIHIGQEQEDTRGVDVRANFLQALRQVRKRQPEELVVSGDLCYMSGEAPIYAWIREQLDTLRIPLRVIPGNHDEVSLMARAFDLTPRLKDGELYYAQTAGSWQALFLDSSRGSLSAIQKNWLIDQLRLHPNRPALVFVHHPPCLAGVPFMDRNHALQDRDELLAILQSHAAPVEVFCGHYHVEKSLRLGRVGVHITPSTFFQIDMHEQDFALDHYRIGFREIWLQPDRLASTVWWAS